MTKTPDLTLTGSLLVAQFNEMVATATDLGIKGFKEVNRFATNAKGVERTQKLHDAIQAHITATAEPEPETGAGHDISTGTATQEEAMPPRSEGSVFSDAFQPNSSLVASEPTAEGEPVPEEETEDEEELERLPDETEEAYMARKAAKKAVKKAAKKTTTKKTTPTNRGKSRSTGGQTIRELTEQYNDRVAKLTKAQKAAAPFAKHHTSLFESKDSAERAFKRLDKAIAAA